MLDMVFNHTSTEHEWFKKALTGEEKYKNFYIWKDPKDGKEPTNWISKFGGTAWEYVEDFDQYYLRLFDVTQGDLNWENEEVRQEIYKVANFWLTKGVKGFRLDVINLISKPDVYEDDQIGDGRRFYTDGPKIHDYLKELNANTFGKHDDVITVGEMSSTTVENCIKYTDPKEKELAMVFNFHHLKVDYDNGDKWTLMDFDFMKLKSIFKDWQEKMQEGNGWGAVFWCCHDQPRIVSRFGCDNEFHLESAKMLGTSVHLMRGTPYVYQGEEIGMKNHGFSKIEQYKDVESTNYYKILKEQGIAEEQILAILNSKSRDNARTPMQWDDSSHAGFTTATPWIEVSNSYKEVNVKNALSNDDSIFYHYQKLIKLRKDYDIISHGTIKMILDDHKQVFAYIRELNDQKLVVLNNYYNKETSVKLPLELINKSSSTILISNYKDTSELQENISLRPYESVAYLIK